MRDSYLIVSLMCVVTIAGCPQGSDQSAQSAPTTPNTVNGPGFTLTLPDSAKAMDAGSSAGVFDYNAFFVDDSGHGYTITALASELVGSQPDPQASDRFDGSMHTASGDYLIPRLV